MIIDFSKLFTIDNKLVKECMTKLNDKLEGKITQKDLELWCAEKMTDYTKELSFEAIPSAPVRLRRFQAAKHEPSWKEAKYDERQRIEKNIYSNDEVAEFVETCDKLIKQNCANAGKLEWAMEVLKNSQKNDLAKKCWAVYNEYPDEITYTKGERIRWIKKHY